ncbi:hypothetical protein HDV06_002885 [Boothiomyces sp. JEL0866]|nr:hypothetical protein HDV06_002885 [Boothiomyces sp. JEL0866]
MRSDCHIEKLSLETLCSIFQYLSSPKFVYKSLPLVSRQFRNAVYSQSIPLLVNVEIVYDDSRDDSNSACLIQLQDSIKILPRFHYTTIPKKPIIQWKSSATLVDERPADCCIEQLTKYSIGLEREIRLHANAITNEPGHLASYMEQLLKKGLNHSSRQMKIIFGNIEIQGKRNLFQKANSEDSIAGFLGYLKPQNIALWNWDTELIQEIGKNAIPTSIRIPIMKHDGHVTVKDFTSLQAMASLTRLELFRPYPRQPWGIEASAFSVLKQLPNLKELIIQSGRLVGRSDIYTESVLGLNDLEVLNMTAWTLGVAHGAQLLLKLKKLRSLQFIHVTTPDFWILLPSYNSPYFLDPKTELPMRNLVNIGLHYMQPDAGDFAIMVQGIIRCMPRLQKLTVRISRPIDSDYDLFTISRDTMERLLIRLAQKTDLNLVVLEIGSRMWASRKSYSDELVALFNNCKMKVQNITTESACQMNYLKREAVVFSDELITLAESEILAPSCAKHASFLFLLRTENPRYMSWFDPSRLIPQVTGWILAAFIFYLYLKFHLFPKILKQLVYDAPLDAEGILHQLHLRSINDRGFELFLHSTVADTKLPIEWLWATIEIPTINVVDVGTQSKIAIIDLSSPLKINGKDDLKVRQTISVDLCDDVHTVKTWIKRMSVMGVKEISKMSIEISFNLTVSIMGLLSFDRVECKKVIDLAELLDASGPSAQSLPKKKFKLSWLLPKKRQLTSPSWLNDLFPDPEITPFANPGLRFVEAGMNFKFSKIPGCNFSLGKIKFRSLLNGSTVGHVTIPGLFFTSESQNARVAIEVQAAALSQRPVTGALTTAKGVLKGALSGIKNGVLYGDWGAQALILGIKDITIENQNGKQVWWVTEIFNDLEFEHDLDAIRKLKSKLGESTSDLSVGLLTMVLGVAEQSNCPIM